MFGEDNFTQELAEGLAAELIAGKKKQDIADTLVERGIVTRQKSLAYVNNFEHGILAANLLIGKNTAVFKEILHKCKSTPEGRSWLGKKYKEHMATSLKWIFIFFAIVVADPFISRLTRMVFVSFITPLALLGLCISAYWTLINFVRLRSLK